MLQALNRIASTFDRLDW